MSTNQIDTNRIHWQDIVGNDDVKVGYFDDDIVIIDNVKALVSPSPTQLKMNLMTICLAGHAQATLDGEPITMKQFDVIICPPNSAFGDFMISPDFEFKAMFFTSHILQNFLREKMTVWNELIYIRKQHLLSMKQADADYFSHFYSLLQHCLDETEQSPYRTEIVQSLLRSGFLSVCGQMKVLMEDVNQQPQMKLPMTLFQRFLNLLEQQPVRHRTVDSYAAELFVTPKYLSSVCKKQSGKTASDWITQQVLVDIRYQLKHTDLSIKQICVQMGFPNPSFFGKFVKRHFGMTPVELRNS